MKTIHRRTSADISPSQLQENDRLHEEEPPFLESTAGGSDIRPPNTPMIENGHDETSFEPGNIYTLESSDEVPLLDLTQTFEVESAGMDSWPPNSNSRAIPTMPIATSGGHAMTEQSGVSRAEESEGVHLDGITEFLDRSPISFTKFNESDLHIWSNFSQAQTQIGATRPSQSEPDSAWFSWPNAPLTKQNHLMTLEVPRSVTHLPSVLVTHWFERVCLIWSGYDSHLNLNRNIAAELWQDSEPVYNCLQSMSAAYLSANIPTMKKTASEYLNDAVRDIALQKESVSEIPQQRRTSAALIFSLLCLGTSSSWIEASQIGTPFFREARTLLDSMSSTSSMTSNSDQHLVRYFEESLSYCEMLLAAVGSGYERQHSRGLHKELPLITESPHPWTGIFSDVPRLFARVLNLCWEFRKRCTKPGTTIHELQSTLRIIEEAKLIHEQLTALTLPAEATHLAVSGTADERTPLDHFVAVAEAYRLASILHLCQTFADVVSMRMTVEEKSTSDRQASWAECVTPLSLRLVELLRTIPSESGTKIMQILLCVSAGTGLRFHSLSRSDDALFRDRRQNSGNIETMSISEYASMFDASGSKAIGTKGDLEKAMLDIGEARGFVLKLMNDLENTLPPRPIVVAKKLIRSIWTAYDTEVSGNFNIHWIDIVESTGLRSFFG